ncbi:unnamed protein product [Prorocentrum cordatum]|uniref:Autophagy-related protein 9 n=1 Tax=Prorocentrum cordatum TaxID=2364126 RepID=A0ABN9T2I6_9DINO|nr:unnamed protein product [Polarella glacialis]
MATQGGGAAAAGRCAGGDGGAGGAGEKDGGRDGSLPAEPRPADPRREGEDGDASGDGGGAGDDAPEGEDDDAAIEEIEWEEMYACPLLVRFTQEKVHPFFYRRGPIVNVVPKIRAVPRGPDSDGECDDVIELVAPFPNIHCLQKGEELWTLDNRRLYALQLAAMEQWPQQCCVRIMVVDKLPRHKFKSQYRKFNTTSEGRTIDVSARYQTFDTWNWFDRAVELEADEFSQRVGTMLSCFEALPVLCALLFRTGLTGFSSRAPFVVGFLAAFAADLLRQNCPALERSVSRLHVRAVMEGEVRQLSPCLHRLRSWWDDGGCAAGDAGASVVSMAQLAAMMALALGLILPYIFGITNDRVRSSLTSCWLGVACVLAVQLVTLLRNGALSTPSFGSGAGSKLSPKHRD